jgi:hypothetical protein
LVREKTGRNSLFAIRFLIGLTEEQVTKLAEFSAQFLHSRPIDATQPGRYFRSGIDGL